MVKTLKIERPAGFSMRNNDARHTTSRPFDPVMSAFNSDAGCHSSQDETLVLFNSSGTCTSQECTQRECCNACTEKRSCKPDECGTIMTGCGDEQEFCGDYPAHHACMDNSACVCQPRPRSCSTNSCGRMDDYCGDELACGICSDMSYTCDNNFCRMVGCMESPTLHYRAFFKVY